MQECLLKCRNIRTKNRTLVYIIAMTVEIVFFKAQKLWNFQFSTKKVSLFKIPFFGCNTKNLLPWYLKVSGCGVLALWKLDVEKVHVAKASSTDGHRVWLLLRWGIFLAFQGVGGGEEWLQNYDYFNYFTGEKHISFVVVSAQLVFFPEAILPFCEFEGFRSPLREVAWLFWYNSIWWPGGNSCASWKSSKLETSRLYQQMMTYIHIYI